MSIPRAAIACVAFALFAIATPAVAQIRPDPNCADDNGVDRCAADQQRRTRELFGVGAIEAHRDARDQVRRVFYVDGYGRDMIVIAFVRARGRDPIVRVHFPRRRGEPPPPIETAIPLATWTEMLRRSEYFDRSFVSETATGSDAMVICLHSWVYTIEATDPARSNGRPASLRRKTEDACQNGPGEVFAMDAQRTALALFPHCDRLDPRQHRNPASQLAACQLLAGDRLAAAEVMNRLDAFRRARRPGDGHHLAGLFVSGATIDWNGVRRPPDGPDAAGFWLERVTGPDGGSFWPERIEGLTADRVRVIGSMERTVDPPEGGRTTFYRAPVEMIWSLTSVQEFQVTAITVGRSVIYRPG